MAAPSKPFTTIIDGQVDANSPVDEILMTSIRDSLVNLLEQISFGFTPAQAHRHNDIDSARINRTDIIITDTVSLFDDFLFDLAGWTILNTGAVLANGPNGLMRISNSAAATFHGIKTVQKAFTLDASDAITFECRLRSNVDVAAFLQFGFTDNTGSQASPANGVWFDNFSVATDRWKARTRASGVETSTDTGVSISSSLETIKLVATTSQVTFFVDDVLVATHVTNIPTVGMNLFLAITGTGEPTAEMIVDFVQATHNR